MEQVIPQINFSFIIFITLCNMEYVNKQLSNSQTMYLRGIIAVHCKWWF
jgi:hypothetical protein